MIENGGVEERVVTVREINTATGIITVEDQYGTPLHISVHTSDPLLAIPSTKEVWIIERLGADWFFFKKMETGDEKTPLSALKPGDRRIESSGTLYLNANDVRINGKQPVVISSSTDTTDRMKVTVNQVVLTQPLDGPASISTGGAFNLNNTSSSGAGLVIYSNHGSGALGRLLVVNSANPAFNQAAMHIAYAGTSHAVSISHNGTGTNSQAYNITSTNQADTALGVIGNMTNRGVAKVVHTLPVDGNGTPITDSSASALSLRVNGDSNGHASAAQGIFLDSDDIAYTGNALTLRNFGADLATLDANGRLTLAKATTGGVGGGSFRLGADVDFFRSAADVCRTNDQLFIVMGTSTGYGLVMSTSGFSNSPYAVRADGRVEFGIADGTVARDVQLSRVAAGVVGTTNTQCIRTGIAATGSRPAASTVGQGSQFFDTTLNKPIWSDNTNWRDAAGTVV